MLLPYFATALLLIATVYSAVVSFREKRDTASASWFFPERTSKAIRISVSVATLLLVIGAVAWIEKSAPHSTRLSSRFLIPEGYTGWVRVEFEVKDAPSLPVENGQYVLKIPASGVLTTSSAEQYGWAKDSYDFYTGTGSHPVNDSGPESLIWGKINGEASGTSGTRKYQEFFVGTNQQFKAQFGRDGNTLQ